VKKIISTVSILVLFTIDVVSQESIYSISFGLGILKSSASTMTSGTWIDTIETNETIESFYIPVRLCWFSGSREFGGIFAEVETQLLQLDAKLSTGWDGKNGLFYNRKFSIGYQFYSRVMSIVNLRIGPVVSFTISQGGYTEESDISVYFVQYEPLGGLNGEIELFPFNTGNGIIDGIHLLLGITTEISLMNYSNYIITPRLGCGYIL